MLHQIINGIDAIRIDSMPVCVALRHIRQSQSRCAEHSVFVSPKSSHLSNQLQSFAVIQLESSGLYQSCFAKLDGISFTATLAGIPNVWDVMLDPQKMISLTLSVTVGRQIKREDDSTPCPSSDWIESLSQRLSLA